MYGAASSGVICRRSSKGRACKSPMPPTMWAATVIVVYVTYQALMSAESSHRAVITRSRSTHPCKDDKIVIRPEVVNPHHPPATKDASKDDERAHAIQTPRLNERLWHRGHDDV
jgi:hypothetical protein